MSENVLAPDEMNLDAAAHAARVARVEQMMNAMNLYLRIGSRARCVKLYASRPSCRARLPDTSPPNTCTAIQSASSMPCVSLPSNSKSFNS